jgi:pyridoxine kinase
MDTVFRMIDRYRNTDDKNRGIPVEKCLDLLSLEDDLGQR